MTVSSVRFYIRDKRFGCFCPFFLSLSQTASLGVSSLLSLWHNKGIGCSQLCAEWHGEKGVSEMPLPGSKGCLLQEYICVTFYELAACGLENWHSKGSQGRGTMHRVGWELLQIQFCILLIKTIKTP